LEFRKFETSNDSDKKKSNQKSVHLESHKNLKKFLSQQNSSKTKSSNKVERVATLPEKSPEKINFLCEDSFGMRPIVCNENNPPVTSQTCIEYGYTVSPNIPPSPFKQ